MDSRDDAKLRAVFSSAEFQRVDFTLNKKHVRYLHDIKIWRISCLHVCIQVFLYAFIPFAAVV